MWCYTCNVVHAGIVLNAVVVILANVSRLRRLEWAAGGPRVAHWTAGAGPARLGTHTHSVGFSVAQITGGPNPVVTNHNIINNK